MKNKGVPRKKFTIWVYDKQRVSRDELVFLCLIKLTKPDTMCIALICFWAHFGLVGSFGPILLY